MSDHRALIEHRRRLKKIRQDVQVLATAVPKSMPILEKRLAREELPWLLGEVARLAEALEQQMEQASVAERAAEAWEANALVYAQNAAAAERRADDLQKLVDYPLATINAMTKRAEAAERERDAALARLREIATMATQWIETPHAGQLLRQIEQHARAHLPGFETEAR